MQRASGVTSTAGTRGGPWGSEAGGQGGGQHVAPPHHSVTLASVSLLANSRFGQDQRFLRKAGASFTLPGHTAVSGERGLCHICREGGVHGTWREGTEATAAKPPVVPRAAGAQWCCPLHLCAPSRPLTRSAELRSCQGSSGMHCFSRWAPFSGSEPGWGSGVLRGPQPAPPPKRFLANGT